MSAVILAVFAVLMFIGSLTLPVSPDKLMFELGPLAMIGTAAYCAHCFGAPGFSQSGASEGEHRDHLKQAVVVLGFTALVMYGVVGGASMSLSGKASTPGSTTERNAMHEVVIVLVVYLTLLTIALRRWAVDDRGDPRLPRTRKWVTVLLVGCIVVMVGRTVYLAPRLPAFRMGEGEGAF